MIYIYNDFGGTHTTILAANYHLGTLDRTRVPTADEIRRLPLFNELTYRDRGTLFRHGTDEEGHLVFTVARGRSKELIPGIGNLVRILQDEDMLRERIVLSNTSPTVPPLLTLGGFLSRGLGWKAPGDPLVLAGARQACRYIGPLVERTKETARHDASPLIVLDNKDFQYSMWKNSPRP